jgi:glycosyltransferase involved in cell wall biosynthesis
VRFTILTATHQRAALLRRVYASLEAQSYRDFEWLVVDDGSIDETASVVAEIAHRSIIPVRYLHQSRAGKMHALARGVREAHGEFIVVLDSDDWLYPNALARFSARWDEIEDKSFYSGVAALSRTPNGEPLGQLFPQDTCDSDHYDIQYVYGRRRGDTVDMIRADILRNVLSADNIVGRFSPEGIMYLQIARVYKTRYVNELLQYKEYLPDGLTAKAKQTDGIRQRAPGTARYLSELLCMNRPMSYRDRVRAYAKLTRSLLYGGKLPAGACRNGVKPLWIVFLAPIALAAIGRDYARHLAPRGAALLQRAAKGRRHSHGPGSEVV